MHFQRFSSSRILFAMALFIFFIPFIFADLDQGLVAYFPMSGNAADASGHGNNGVVTGAVLTQDRFNQPGKAYSFDGNNDYIDCGNSSILNISGTGSKWSATAWIKFSGTQANYFICKADNTSVGWNVGIDAGRFVGRMQSVAMSATNSFNMGTTNTFNDGVWHFVYVEFNAAASDQNTAIQISVDGQWQTLSKIAGWYANGQNYNNSGHLMLGGHPNYPPCLICSLDEVRIYSRALTDEELQSLVDNPVAYFPFNGNATDESGHGNNGNVSGAVLTQDRFNLPNNAYSFDGSNDYIDCGNASSLNISGAGSQWSATAWVKFSGTQATYFIDKNDNTSVGWDVGIDAGRLVGRMQSVAMSATNSFNMGTTNTFNNGVWHFVYVEFNAAAPDQNSAIKISVDGQWQTLTKIAGWYANGQNYNNTGHLMLGGNPTYPPSINGNLDEIRVFSRALTDDEIHSLANDLVAYYPFNGNANDESGRGNNGIVTGAVLAQDRFNQPGKAYSFDGNNEYIDCGNSSSLNISGTGSQWSAIAWINFSGNQATYFIDKNDNVSVGWDVGVDSGRIVGRMQSVAMSATNSFNMGTSVVYNNGSWHFLYVEFNAAAPDQNSAIKISVDGQWQTLTKIAGWYANGQNYNNTGHLMLGGNPTYPPSINGSLDDIRIYSRALTEEEIQILYGSTGCTPPAVYTYDADMSTDNSIKLQGNANPNGFDTSAYFQWGASTSYGNETAHQSVGSGIYGVIYAETISSLAANAIFHYRAVAASACGTTYGPDKIFMTLVAPSRLEAVLNFSGGVDLFWQDNSSNEAGFLIQRAAGNTESWASIGTVGADETAFVDTGVTADTTYRYRVRAFTTTCNSSFSNVASAKVGDYDLYLPVAAHTPGVTGVWRTDVVLLNLGATAASVQVACFNFNQANPTPTTVTVPVPAGGLVKLADVLSSTFTISNAALGFRFLSGAVVVHSRFYNIGGGAGTYGMGVPAASADQALCGDAQSISGDNRSFTLFNYLAYSSSTSSGFRTNIGFVNASDFPVDLFIKLYGDSGELLGSRTQPLAAYEHRQITKIHELFGVASTINNGYATVEVITRGGKVHAYAMVIDNLTGDPLYWAPTLMVRE